MQTLTKVLTGLTRNLLTVFLTTRENNFPFFQVWSAGTQEDILLHAHLILGTCKL